MEQNKTLSKWILEMMIRLIQCLSVTSNLINYLILIRNREQKRLKSFLAQVMMSPDLHINLTPLDCQIKPYTKLKILVTQMSMWRCKKFNHQPNSWRIKGVSNQLKVFLQTMIKILSRLKVKW